MHQLHEAIDDLHLEIHKLTPPTAIRKAVRSFATGLVKGVGFVVGTTLIAALLIYFVQQSLESGKLQDWVGDQVRGAITESIDEYTPSFLQRDQNVQTKKEPKALFLFERSHLESMDRKMTSEW